MDPKRYLEELRGRASPAAHDPGLPPVRGPRPHALARPRTLSWMALRSLSHPWAA